MPLYNVVSFFRDVMYVHACQKLLLRLTTPVKSCLIRIVDNDSGEEFMRSVFSPCNIKPNEARKRERGEGREREREKEGGEREREGRNYSFRYTCRRGTHYLVRCGPTVIL